jgi:hypothetical protein
MKRVLTTVLAIVAILSTATASADFFTDRVVSDFPQATRLENVELSSYRFKDPVNEARYRDALYFLSSVKTAVRQRYDNGAMDNYAFSDTLTEIEGLTYSLNQGFANLSLSEKRNKKFYKSLAADDFADAAAAYDRLKAATWKR